MSNVLYQTVISRQGGGAGLLACWRARVGAECWLEGSNRDTDVHNMGALSSFPFQVSIVHCQWAYKQVVATKKWDTCPK